MSAPAAEETLKPQIFGPLHGGPAALLVLRAQGGETLSAAEIETGFSRRAIAELLSSTTAAKAAALAYLYSPLSGAHAALAFCSAAEKSAGITVPQKAALLRILSCETERLFNHLSFLGKFASACGNQPLRHWTLLDREIIMSLNKWLTGSRLGRGFICIGGTSREPENLFFDKAFDFVHYFEHRTNAYENASIGSISARNNLAGAGIISSGQAEDFRLSGPNLRACGAARDLRKEAPYSLYERVQFAIPYTEEGSALNRIKIRVEEMRQSNQIISQCLEMLEYPEKHGIISNPPTTNPVKEPALTKGSFSARVEAPSGELEITLQCSGKKDKPFSQVTIISASAAACMAAGQAVSSAQANRAAAILASFDISPWEADG